MGDDIRGAPVQQKLLTTILNAWYNQRRMPTFEEIAGQHGMAKSGVQSVIKKLLEKGYLQCERTPSGNVRAGSIRPAGKALGWQQESGSQDMLIEESDTRPVRVHGDAGASELMLISEESGTDGEYMPLPSHHVRQADVFMLRVFGESMSGDDLHTGDHLIVDPQAPFSDGDMVVVLDRGAVRVKRLWDDGSHIVLESSNSEYEPIRLEKGKEHLGEAIIQGKVIGRVLWHVKPGRRNEQTT